ncbi:MAG: hypothetical protein QXI12_04135 [Candidatus Methanomethyliaceae archaeon]
MSIVQRTKGEVKFYIVGPLGFWTFPLLNALISTIIAIRSVSQAQAQLPARTNRIVVYEVVRDEKGRIVEIVEHEREG